MNDIKNPAKFEEFWAAYPRRIGKGAARKAWSKAICIATPEDIIEGVKRYSGEVVGKELKWVAHPATWLNAERWTDEVGANSATKVVQLERAPGVDSRWPIRLQNYRPGGFWASTWGLRPESDGAHECPENLVQEWRAKWLGKMLDAG